MKNLSNALKNEADLRWKNFIESPYFWNHRFLHHQYFRPRASRFCDKMLFQLIIRLRFVCK